MSNILTIEGNEIDVDEITEGMVLPKNENLKEIIVASLVIAHKYKKGMPRLDKDVVDKNALLDDLCRLKSIKTRFGPVVAQYESKLTMMENRFKNQLDGEFYLEARNQLEKKYDIKYEKYKSGEIEKPKPPTDTNIKALAEMKSKDNRKMLSEAQGNVKHVRVYWGSIMESINVIKAVLKYKFGEQKGYDPGE